MELQAASASAMIGTGRALEQARASVPELPWGEHGLADVALEWDDIEYNDEAERYEVQLADGRVAVLTLDHGVQSHLESIQSGYPEPGEAAVAIDVATGRVLGIADDSTGTSVGSGLARRAYAYAASTFKVITAATLLTEGVASVTDEVCFSGGGSGFHLSSLDATSGELCVDMIHAMAHSSNLYFGRMADQRLTPEVLERTARRFGYNTRIPFELPLERSIASIPDDRLEFARSAAGFRHTWLSPLHGALIQASIANHGEMMVPTIVDHIEDAEGRVVWTHTPVVWRTVAQPAVITELARTLSRTCVSGTARNYFALRQGWPSSVVVQGKTGTLSNATVDGDQPDQSLLFTWFTGYADLGARTVAVSGLVASAPQWYTKGSYMAAEAVLAASRMAD
jgi:cell division protein FtsI/penicillin-binding protein 2